MSDKIYSIAEIKSIATPFATQYGVDAMYLFGSYARSEAKATSDLDFRIERGRIRSLFTLSAMQQDLITVFHKDVDLITSQNLDPAFALSIGNEEILIYRNRNFNT